MSDRLDLEEKVRRLICRRDFIDRRSSGGWCYTCPFIEVDNYKIVVRQYAGLCFVVGYEDGSENELAIRELIHLFVQGLDIYFKNVCELDLILNCSQVQDILDEMIIGGEINCTDIKSIANNMKNSKIN